MYVLETRQDTMLLCYIYKFFTREHLYTIEEDYLHVIQTNYWKKPSTY